MNEILNLLPEGLVNALGHTLLHALWQGAAVAIALSLLLVLMHNQSAHKLYWAACSAMLAQLLFSGATFAYYYSTAPFPGQVYLDAAPAAAVPAVRVTWEAPLEQILLYFEQHLPLVVTLWLLGVALMALRLIGGLAYTQRLRHYRTTPLGQQWQQKAQELARTMGISQTVRLAESALVQVPIVIGAVKPVILLPVGAATGLSQAQVEAVLAHELAHILRRDYLANLLQSVVDVLFFFHPAMWWVSGVVRAEREHCCDDIAVNHCPDTLTYARALAELEALRLPQAPAMTMALSGKRGSLMGRMKRLLGQQGMRPSFGEGFAAGLVLVVSAVLLSFSAMAELQPAAGARAVEPLATEEPTGEAITYNAQDSTGQNRSVVIITNKKGKVKELYVDGKRIPKGDIVKYKTLLDQRLQATQNAHKATTVEVDRIIAREEDAVADARGRNIEERVIIRRSGNETAPLPPLPPLPPAAPQRAAPVPPAPPAPPAGASKAEQEAYERRVEQYEHKVEELHQQASKLEATERQLLELRIAQDTLKRSEMRQQQQERATEARARMEARREEMQARRQEMEAEREERRQRMDEFKEQLVKDGIIESKSSNLSVQISNGELTINGKKQPQEVYNKYKQWLEPTRR